MESALAVPNEGYHCFVGMRKYHQFGRYLNHAHSPNATMTALCKVREKWRIGFLAVRDIKIGDEVVWDCSIQGEVWSRCKLIGGAVQLRRGRAEQENEETKEGKTRSCRKTTQG